MIKSDSPSPEAPGTDPLIGRTLNGRFSILEPLGVGGMGKVYRALQAPLERVVALKVLNPNFPSSRDPGFQKRFLREASLTSKLRHPNTVTVIDYGQTDDGIYYIAMEYLEGRTLQQVLGQAGPLPWARAVSVAQQVCRSLREAHALGIVHRDLKPANIMILNEADQDLVKVLDFGLVKSVAPQQEGPVSPEITQNGTFLGSPQYMAPEQARNVADARSDVYSLGIMLFQMLMGRPPFIARDHIELIFAHYKEPPPTFQSVRPDLAVPPEIEMVVRRCLEKDPARRFQTMDELLEGLREAHMAAGGNSGVFRRLGGATTTGPYPSPPTTGPYASPLFANVGNAEPADGGLAVDISVEVPADVQRARQRTLMMGALGGVMVAGLVGITLFLLRGGGAEDKPAQPAAQAAAPTAQAPVAEAPTAAPAPGKVRFRLMSQPSGARVYYKGKEKGVTPFVMELPLGSEGSITAELTFALEGYQTETLITGGSGEVVLSQKLTRRRGGGERPSRVDLANASTPEDFENVAPATPGGLAAPVMMQATAPSAPAAVPAATSDKALGALGASAATPVSAAGSLAVPSLTTGALAPVNPNAVIPFNDAMERPTLLEEGRDIAYTREALAIKAEGLVAVRCTITNKGRVENCRILKMVQHMDKAVLDSLQSRVYKPIQYQGRPANVDYTFTMRLVSPRR
ncbi:MULTISPECIES: TonB family protein [unclassified Corallococcus]|uniref:TonB family protein n=1 Tax=unclassified Corallococcus TaxID=2685029 RepID=UPI001A8EBE69|nr:MULTISPECIES: TonB family protein [unclassified Corallococcus]MBN9684028.1 TonB family protein [Corallococcus sp. NCSPR001]WAS84476.1 TonB family protein [Corallococcus sp. NCRR]